MKIKTKRLNYEGVLALPHKKHFNPARPSLLLNTIIRVASAFDLAKVGFKYTKQGEEVLKKEPCLILMNHSSFIDLEIASKLLYPQKYSIVCTSDGFVGKKWLMKAIGCIPTNKFVTDLTLIRDIKYSLSMGNHVLMYPEASYSFDGRPTPLPKKLGMLVKKLGVPVVCIKTQGAFSHDPLYNCLQKRKVKVTAKLFCLISADEVSSLSGDAIGDKINEVFTFDSFKWQHDNKIRISEPFRADGLERILYKCPHCGGEGKTVGKGVHLTCACGKQYYLDEYGKIVATDGSSLFTHIPDWYDWQRTQVREQIKIGEYLLDTEVSIGMLVDYKAIYMIGEGRLIHDQNGFLLIGADGKLEYRQSPLAAYSLYSDYYWYEIDDVICIGDNSALYYCFPKKKGVVAKTRLAAEELYKLKKQNT